MKVFLLGFSMFLSSCSTTLLDQLNQTKSWGYQLQNYDKKDPLIAVKKSPHRMWVLDPDFDGQEVDKSQLSKVINLGTLPIAYLSIGEAEVYRDYFKNLNKEILLKENPQWKGNYKVQYWKDEWQKIIFSKLDQLIALGFKGVYLDIVDAFYYFNDKEIKANQMVDFIAAIRKHALSKTDEFLVIQQNAPTLYQYTTKPELLFSNVDALALEDVFFFGDKEHDNPYLPQDYAFEAVKLYSQKGLKVFNVEYLKKEKAISLYSKQWRKTSVIPLVANRSLSGPLLFSEDL